MSEELRRSWDDKAADWHIQVGEEGDANRRINSDPVLWRLLGDVEGRTVLDAGCGTGYLSVKLARAGATVIGVDQSPEMIRIAAENIARAGVAARLHVGSASQLAALPDASIDRIVSNYVLMDLPDLEGAMAAFARVLRPGGHAVVVFLHPCFCPPGGWERLPDGRVRTTWPWSYLERRQFEESWGHFRSPFIGFHRPLSAYFAAIFSAGLAVTAFEEPAAENREGLTQAQVDHIRMTPYSVVMRLHRP